MGRRWGKTVLGGVLTMNVLRQHGRAAWVVPTYKNGRSLWRYVENLTAPLRAARLMDVSRAERTVTTSRSGFFGLFSADNADAMRGEAFNLVVVDEAARVSEEAIRDVIDPTLADADGDGIYISTPKGLNWFYEEFQRGALDGKQQAAFTAPSSANPSPNIQKAFELARTRVTSRTFRQEWQAQFVSDGAYFQDVDAAACIETPDAPEAHAGHTCVMGVDWAKSNDWTVLTVLCRNCSRVVDWQRFNQIDFIFQRERVKALAARWRVTQILPERNSIGEPNIEMLRADGLPIAVGTDLKPGFFTSASSKALIIEGLALGLINGLKVPREFAAELRAFEIETKPVGPAKFGAPEGGHDDCVISLALAWHQASQGLQLWV